MKINEDVVGVAIRAVIVEEAHAFKAEGASFGLHAARFLLVEIVGRELAIALRAQADHGLPSVCPVAKILYEINAFASGRRAS